MRRSTVGQLTQAMVDATPSAPPTLGVVGTVRELVGYIARFRMQGLLLAVALLIDVAYDVVVPMSTGLLVDRAIGPKDIHVFTVILLVLAGGFVVASISAIGRDYLYAWLGTRVLHELRLRLFAHLQRLSMDYFGRARAGDIVSHFSTDLAAIENVLVVGLPSVFLAIGTLIVSIVLLFLLEWRLASLIVIALPFCVIAPRILGRRALDIGTTLRHEQGVLAGMVHENLQAQRVIKAFSLRDSALAQFREQSTRIARRGLSFGFYAYSAERAPNIGMGLFAVAVLGVGGYLAVRGQMQVGTLVSFQLLFLNVSAAVLTLSSFAPTLLSATGALEHIHSLLATTPRLDERPGAADIGPLRTAIRLENVAFAYAGQRRGLDHVSLEIPAGARVAFVGPSGCGKSTCLSLILRFFDPDEGRVTYDGIDLRGVSLTSLSTQIGVVFQDSFLFNTTIRENVRMGRVGASDADVEAACRLAELHDTVRALPMGYDTVVGEAGGRLSGGQRQRVAIARALIRRPSILVLDEATSALDPSTEAAVNTTLGTLARRQTTITVTHRLEPLVGYDRIIVFQAGRVVESGTHEELLAGGRLYADMWSKQHAVAFGDGDGQATVDPESLRRVSIFRELDDTLLRQLAGMFAVEEASAGTVIFEQGDAGDRFYVVAHGRVRISGVDPEGHEYDLDILQDGDNFGEVALWEDAPRNATATAETPTVFLTLRRAPFQRLLDRSPTVRAAIREQTEKRRGASGPTVTVG